MKKVRYLFVSLFIQMGVVNVWSQPCGDEWQYDFFDDWHLQGDSVIGKYDEGNAYFFRFLGGSVRTINGKEYNLLYQHPLPIPTATQRIQSEVIPADRWKYSIGIRFENGRVLTDYEDFRFYQSCHLIYDDYRFPLFSHGDPNYLPYNLTADNTELILYDYTMEVGDSYRHVDGHEDIFVVKKDTIEISGKPGVPLRRLTLNNGLVLIEGIGCINSNGMLIDYLNPESQYASRYTYLSACYRNVDDYVYYNYVKDCGISIVDRATLGVSSSICATHSSKSCIYDLQGRQIQGTPKRGIYIKDGKKVLVGDKR